MQLELKNACVKRALTVLRKVAKLTLIDCNQYVIAIVLDSIDFNAS